MKLIYYDVFTKDGIKIMSNKTSREISETLGIAMTAVPRYADYGKCYKGKYRFVKLEGNNDEIKNGGIPEELWKEWDRVRAVFKKVIWVTEYEYGVKRLGTKKVG